MNVSYRVDPHVAREVAAGRTERLAAELRTYARRHLRAAPGYFVLSGMAELAEADARRFVLAASRILGRVMPSSFSGELIREVRYRGVRIEETATARYSDTRQGGNLHTDGIHRPGPVPAYFALYCVRQAAVGGAMVLVHVDDIVRELRAEPDLVAALRIPVHIDTRDDTPGRPRTVQRPILDLSGGTARVCYLREYIDSGHRQPGVRPLAAAQVRALDALDALLDRSDLHTQLRLEPGEMVFVDNRSVIHGRTPFEVGPDPGSDRLLLRTWIAGPP